jgi:hypothetical protein
MVLLLVALFNAILRTLYFPPVWKHARVISILKPGKDPALPSSYRPISPLDTIGKVFEKILLGRILSEESVGYCVMSSLVSDPNIAHPCSCTASLKVSRNFGEKRLTSAVFLDETKAFDTVWVDDLAYKLMAFKFPSYLVKTIPSYLRSRTFEASFQAATSSHRHMRAIVAQGGLITPVLFSLYVNDIPVPSRHVELALYADDPVVIAMSRKPARLVSYLESYLADLELWLRKWRLAINVSKSMAMLFTRGRIQSPRPVALFGGPIVWVDTARYLGVILDKRLTWSTHINQVRKKASQRLGVLGPLLSRSGLSIRNGVLLFRQLIRPMMEYACPVWRSAAR